MTHLTSAFLHKMALNHQKVGLMATLAQSDHCPTKMTGELEMHSNTQGNMSLLWQNTLMPTSLEQTPSPWLSAATVSAT